MEGEGREGRGKEINIKVVNLCPPSTGRGIEGRKRPFISPNPVFSYPYRNDAATLILHDVHRRRKNDLFSLLLLLPYFLLP